MNRFGKLNVPSMKETVEYKFDQLFQQFGTEIVKVGRVNRVYVEESFYSFLLELCNSLLYTKFKYFEGEFKRK